MKYKLAKFYDKVDTLQSPPTAKSAWYHSFGVYGAFFTNLAYRARKIAIVQAYG